MYPTTTHTKKSCPTPSRTITDTTKFLTSWVRNVVCILAPLLHINIMQFVLLLLTAYLIGPLARAVRILTFQTVTPLFELAIYSATYYYRTITSLLANFLGRFFYEVACLLGVDQLIYGYSGGFGGGALGYDPFPVVCDTLTLIVFLHKYKVTKAAMKV
jgi:hypothetical protein